MAHNNNKKNNFVIPGAIVVAGILIAGAVVLSNGSLNLSTTNTTQHDGVVQNEQDDEIIQASRPRPIDETDHVLGNPNASIVIIEYSDFECPFCKRFHETMHTVIEEFPNDVAWVYRQWPIDSLHQQARTEAIASECVAELGGNDAFWTFADSIFETTTSNDGLDLSVMPDLAETAGVDRGAFQTCLDEERTAGLVQEDIDEAIATGGQGTPHSLMLFGDDQIVAINGAQPIENMRAAIDQILAEE